MRGCLLGPEESVFVVHLGINSATPYECPSMNQLGGSGISIFAMPLIHVDIFSFRKSMFDVRI